MIFASIPPIRNPVVTGIANANPSDAGTIFGKMFASLVGLFLVIASLWAFAQIFIGGINWISSGGDKGKLEIAQHRITNAVVGLLFVFAAWAIYIMVLQFLGISPIGSSQIQLKIPKIL